MFYYRVVQFSGVNMAFFYLPKNFNNIGYRFIKSSNVFFVKFTFEKTFCSFIHVENMKRAIVEEYCHQLHFC